jgi:hypothetical protein
MSVVSEITCNACGETKPVSEFHRDRSQPTGYKYSCKKCYNNRYVLGEENRKIKARLMREYRAKSEKYLYRKRNKRVVAINALGGKCECCGEARIEFLTIDHINGLEDRIKNQRSGEGLIDRVRKEGYPKDKYRVLCYNCNCSLGFYGYCPHQSPEIDFISHPKF